MSDNARQFVPQQGRPPKPDPNRHAADRRMFAQQQAQIRSEQCDNRPPTTDKEK